MYCSRCGTWAADELASCATCGAALQVDAGAHGARVTRGPAVSAIAAEPAVRYGGFWRRAAAFLLDWLVLFFPEGIARALLGFDAFETSQSWSDPREWMLLGASLVLGLLYHSILASSPVEGTLGQRALDLRMSDGDGRRLTFARATVRWFASLLTLLTCGVGWLLMLWTPRRQTLHDLMSGTFVVRAGRPRPERAPETRVAEAR